MKKYRNETPRKDPMLPWKLDIDLDGTPRCKLYSQLTFCENEDEFTAPPVTPVEGFKYAPLVKLNKRRSFTSSNMSDNLFPLYDEFNSCYDHSTNTNEVREPEERAPLPLKYREPRKKEKLGFTEDCCVTTSYSSESIFLKNGIEGVNEDSRSNTRHNSSLELQAVNKDDENQKKIDNSTTTSSCTYISEDCKEDGLGAKREKYRSSNDVGTETCSAPQARRSRPLYKNPIQTRDTRLKEVDKIRSIESLRNTLDQEKHIVSKLWRCALLANRSLNNSNNSMYRYDDGNSVGYKQEKHTFLRKGNSLHNYKRTVRLRSSTKLLDSNYHSMNDLCSCKLSPEN